MAQNRLKHVPLLSYARADMLWVTGGFTSEKSAGRQRAIESVAKLHGINLANAKSFVYDPALKDEGKTVSGHIKIGPEAFDQDRPWLAYVILHEAVHADQFAFYAGKGIQLPHTRIGTPPHRKLRAVDEFEAHYIPWRNQTKVGLSEQQIDSVNSKLRHWALDIRSYGDKQLYRLVSEGRMKQAREVVLKELSP